jgi:hypothetical protein
VTSTFEAWLNIVDTHNKDHAVLAMSEFDGTQTPPYQNPDGLQVRVSQGRTRFYRGSDQSCSSTACKLFNTGWHHLAVTWAATTGRVQLYIDGALIQDQVHTDGQFATNLTPFGSMLLGQEPDSFAGLFDENQSFDGLIDEVRFWNTIRTQAEIQANMHHTLSHLSPAAMATQGLALLYDFDDAATIATGIVEDKTTNLNSGLMGQLISTIQWCTYSTARPATLPTKPKSVSTSASLPIAGSAPLEHFLVPSLLSTNITLIALSDTTNPVTLQITTMPLKGTLQDTATGAPITINTPLASPHLTYVYDLATHGNSYAPLTLIDTVQYSASDTVDTGFQDVNLFSHAMQNPSNLHYTTDAVTGIGMVLGTLLADGTQPIVVIESLPTPVPANSLVTGARLYQTKWTKPEASALYSDFNSDLTGRVPLAALDQITTPNSVAWFVPPKIGNVLPNLPAPVNIVFTFRYQHAISGVLSAPATVTVRVKPIDSAPTSPSPPTLTLDLMAAPLTVRNESYGVVTLTAADPDGSFLPSIYQRITTLPKFGSLWQVDAQGAIVTGPGAQALTVASSSRNPTVSSWATRVLNSSSQYLPAGCPASCDKVLTCNYTVSCDRSYTAVKILGPNDWSVNTGKTRNVLLSSQYHRSHLRASISLSVTECAPRMLPFSPDSCFLRFLSASTVLTCSFVAVFSCQLPRCGRLRRKQRTVH